MKETCLKNLSINLCKIPHNLYIRELRTKKVLYNFLKLLQYIEEPNVF